MPGDNGTFFTINFSKEWGQIQELLDTPKVMTRVHNNMIKAHNANGKILKREIVANIDKGKYAHGRTPNAPLTKALKRKRGGTPLVDTRKFLRKLITTEVIAWDEMEIGYPHELDDETVATLFAIHDGTNILVTEPMRVLFAVLAQVSQGRRDPSTLYGRAAEMYERVRKGFVFKPLAESTTHIEIPPRPFIEEVLYADSVQLRLQENFQQAIGAAIVNVPPKFKK